MSNTPKQVDISTTGNFHRLLHSGDRSVVLEGSSRSSKTFSCMQYCIHLALSTPNFTIKVYRFDQATARKTLVPDFTNIIATQFKLSLESWNKTDACYTFKNGSTITFGGTSDPAKLQGVASDLVWLNEVTEIRYESYTQLAMRCRGKFLFDFNPSLNTHWIFDRVLTDTTNPPLYIHSTYKDNPFLTAKQIYEIEKLEPTPANIKQGTANGYLWDVYGLGKRGVVDGAIFTTNWQLTDTWPLLNMCNSRYFGLDFGLRDPTALSELRYHNDSIYVRQHIYEPNLLITRNPNNPDLPSIQGILEDMEAEGLLFKHDIIVADCARPEAIADLRACGYNVSAFTKGPNTIANGLHLMQGLKFMVHRSSQDLQREFEQLKWKRAVGGEYIDGQPDQTCADHLLDGIRYVCMRYYKGKQINSIGAKRKPISVRTGKERFGKKSRFGR